MSGTTDLLHPPGRVARRIRRYPLTLPVSYTHEGKEHVGESIDISAHALRLRCGANAPAEKSPVELSLEVPGSTIRPRLMAQVLRVGDAEMVVEFDESPDVLMAFLRNLVITQFPNTIQATRLLMTADSRTQRASFVRPRAAKISVVVPLFNEAAMIGLFHAELSQALAAADFAYEIIYVNDGSSDDTITALDAAVGPDPRNVQIVSLSRNFGHQAALCAGLEVCTGAAVVTMDGDLQHPPSLIPKMVAEWRAGFDIVNTIRSVDSASGAVKGFASDGFYALFDWLTALRLPRGAADFRLLDGRLVDEILSFPERHLFWRGLTQWVGFKKTFVEYAAPPRAKGQTKFTMRKMLSLASDGIFSFSVVPLRLAFIAGLSMLLMVLAVVVYVVRAYVLGVAVPGWSSSLIIAAMFSGIELLVLGVIAEYVGRIFTEVKHRPRYLTTAAQSDLDEPVLAAFCELVRQHQPARAVT